MARQRHLGRLFGLVAGVIFTSLVAAAPVAAYAPPVGGTWGCSYPVTGYTPDGSFDFRNANASGDATWYGYRVLQWQLCVIANSAGQHKAKVQLTADAYPNENNRFFGVIKVQLQACGIPLIYPNIATAY